MSFLKDLFKRKPGGTFVGNSLRTLSSAYTGGAMGSGRMMITELDADKRDLNDTDFFTKYGRSKALAYPGTLPLVGYANNGSSSFSSPATDLAFAWLKRNWYVPALVIAAPFTYLIIKMSRRNGYRR